MDESIEQLYSLHYYDLYRFLTQYCPNQIMIDDIIQSTFLEALKHIESFRGHSSLKTWLFGIAKYEMYREFRKNKQHVNIDDLSESNFVKDEDYADKLFAQQILETIDEFSPPLREIVRLRIVHGLSFKEIGRHVGRTENYCRVNFFRAKERLRKEYEYE